MDEPRSRSLDEETGAEAASAAHGDEGVTAVRALELVERLGDEDRARGAERMPEGDRPAVRIDLAGIDGQFLSARPGRR